MKQITIILLSLFCTLGAIAQEEPKSEKDIYTEQMKTLIYAYRGIHGLYVDSVENEKLVETAIRAMLKELDPHSSYIPPKDVDRANEPLKGNFDGIGIQFNVLEDTLIVISPIPGGPSEKVGILAGDRIVKVDTTTIAGVKCSRERMMELLRGEKGTKVKVLIKRRGEPELIPFTITRDKIPIYSVNAAYMLTPEIGYVKLTRFASTSVDEFKEAFAKLQKQGMKHLVFDLQANSGGRMQPAIQLADFFLDEEQLVVYTQGRRSPKRNYHATTPSSFPEGELVLLVDESSASSSEILSGAIQDWDKGTIIGRRTFGKGLVQRPINLPDGAEIRITTARYYTPTGRSIQKPYEAGESKAYRKDLKHRYESGELVNADSIEHSDSLVFKTLVEGRTVYGGGGIIPDVFVPLDTTTYSKFHKKVVSKGILNSFVMVYIDDHRKTLEKKYKDFESFEKDFEVTGNMFEALVEKAAEDSIIYDPNEFEVSHDYLYTQMKALVARDLFEMNEYYMVMNRRNESVHKAIEVIEGIKND